MNRTWKCQCRSFNSAIPNSIESETIYVMCNCRSKICMQCHLTRELQCYQITYLSINGLWGLSRDISGEHIRAISISASQVAAMQE
jgi:hypothetical protein